MRIKKVSQTTPTQAQVVDGYSTSTTDSYSCNYVNNFNELSTTEKVCGKWIDGKTLYRKTVSLTPTSYGEVNFANVISHSGIAMFDKAHTFLLRSSGAIMTGIGEDGNAGFWFDARQIATNGSLGFYVGQSVYSGSTIYATIIYTKD